jgi:lipoprotein-anchoring transpeptidase ErfK/SrfK
MRARMTAVAAALAGAAIAASPAVAAAGGRADAAAVAAAGARADAAAAAKAAAPWAPTAERAHLARVVVPTAARSRPGGGRVVARLHTQAPWTGGPVQLLVLRRRDARGRRWLKVRLASRPNRAAGWIDADRVRVTRTPWRVVVHTRSRRVAVYRAGRLRRRFGAVVGHPSTPTPRGLFAIAEKARQPDPSGFLGPWALHLTAHSTVLDDYGGGAGRVALHGRSGASLADPLGTARSHGCVRIDNRHVAWLARKLPVGAPVLIRR